jgi:hypothetical protein
LQGYINTQNNRYWSSQNPHLTHEALLCPVKVGVWCTLSTRIVGPVFLMKQLTVKDNVLVILGQLFSELAEEESLWLISARLSYCPHSMYVYAGFVWGL